MDTDPPADVQQEVLDCEPDSDTEEEVNSDPEVKTLPDALAIFDKLKAFCAYSDKGDV